MSIIAPLLRAAPLILLASLLVAASCTASGTGQFGAPCEVGADCLSDYCVGGEAGGPFFASFCSEDCAGRKMGDPCGGGFGRCIADFTAWCWVPCETDADCAPVNAQRAVCGQTSSSGKDAPFKVCVAGTASSG